AFPRYSDVSQESYWYEHPEKPKEDGLLLYSKIKECITNLMLEDIYCPKEIRLSISQYVCENLPVIEAQDSKCSLNTIKELRTLVKGFIYYVQSDISSVANRQESKKLMICLGNGYPTLYFVQQDLLNEEENSCKHPDNYAPTVLKVGSTKQVSDYCSKPSHIVRICDETRETLSVVGNSQPHESPLKIIVKTGLPGNT
ncbi:hypothetical protein SK128_013565, partial [Halocaridina rubra]